MDAHDLMHDPRAVAAVQAALAEDVGPGDATTLALVDPTVMATGEILAREACRVAGACVGKKVLECVDPTLEVEIVVPDGRDVAKGGTILTIRGKAASILVAERTALNFMQRMSGIATLTSRFVEAVRPYGTTILDTRKTTPGLRVLEKMAAAAGGVTNHRMGLHDAILIKNNHITACGGVRAALAAVSNQTIPAEIEVRTLEELDEALDCGAKRLLLDNLTPEEARRWIARIAGRATTELSGGITLETARAYAQAGADFLSAGAITHSARAVDINFRLTLA
jgi:nicotinate-nucleotide pyrophosphorylase (carboxylating)